MNIEEKHHRRVRRVKKLLRLLPQKTRLERYPIIGRFAATARKSTFLWSFRTQEVFPAFLMGWIVCLTPLLGCHFLIALGCAFLFHANLLILAALQLVTTPLTIPVLWPLIYGVGKVIVQIFTGSRPAMTPIADGSLLLSGKNVLRLAGTMTMGAIFLGSLAAFLSMFIYKLCSRHFERERQNYRKYVREKS